MNINFSKNILERLLKYFLLIKSLYVEFFKELLIKKIFFLFILSLIFILIKKYDLIISLYFKNNKSSYLDALSLIGNFIGDGKILFIILPLLTIIFYVWEKKNLEKIFFISTITVSAISLLNLLFKGIFSRERPLINYDPAMFFSYKRAINLDELFAFSFTSFPSGHMISITTLSVYLALNIGNNYIRIMLFLIPLFTAFSRVYSQVHWTSDVVMSYFLGSIFAVSTFKFIKKILN